MFRGGIESPLRKGKKRSGGEKKLDSQNPCGTLSGGVLGNAHDGVVNELTCSFNCSFAVLAYNSEKPQVKSFTSLLCEVTQ